MAASIAQRQAWFTELLGGAVWLVRGRAALRAQHIGLDVLEGVVLGGRQTSWRDGTTHLVMSPLEFIQRLAAWVPRPRLHLIRFHGVLAPNAKLRALVVPQVPESPAPAAPPAEGEATCAHHRPARLSWAKLLKRVFEIDIEHCPNCGGELRIIAAKLEQLGNREGPHAPGFAGQGTASCPPRGSQLQAA